MFQDQKDVELVLSALGDQLEGLLNKPVELLVCGGSALNVLGLVRRATKDVDILAYIERNEKGETFLIKAASLTPELVMAAKKVARDFNLPDDWLNTGPASAVDLGLPNGFMDRVTTRVFGNKLAVHFLGHYDFKNNYNHFLRTIIRNFDKGDSLSPYLLSIAVPFLIQYPY